MNGLLKILYEMRRCRGGSLTYLSFKRSIISTICAVSAVAITACGASSGPEKPKGKAWGQLSATASNKTENKPNARVISTPATIQLKPNVWAKIEAAGRPDEFGKPFTTPSLAAKNNLASGLSSVASPVTASNDFAPISNSGGSAGSVASPGLVTQANQAVLPPIGAPAETVTRNFVASATNSNLTVAPNVANPSIANPSISNPSVTNPSLSTASVDSIAPSPVINRAPVLSNSLAPAPSLAASNTSTVNSTAVANLNTNAEPTTALRSVAPAASVNSTAPTLVAPTQTLTLNQTSTPVLQAKPVLRSAELPAPINNNIEAPSLPKIITPPSQPLNLPVGKGTPSSGEGTQVATAGSGSGSGNGSPGVRQGDEGQSNDLKPAPVPPPPSGNNSNPPGTKSGKVIPPTTSSKDNTGNEEVHVQTYAMTSVPAPQSNTAHSPTQASGAPYPDTLIEFGAPGTKVASLPKQGSGVPFPDTIVVAVVPQLDLKLEEVPGAVGNNLPHDGVTVKVAGTVIEYGSREVMKGFKGQVVRIVDPIRRQYIEVEFIEESQLAFTWTIDPKSWNPQTGFAIGWEAYLMPKDYVATQTAPNSKDRNKNCEAPSPDCFSEQEIIAAKMDRIGFMNSTGVLDSEVTPPTLTVDSGGSDDVLVLTDFKTNTGLRSDTTRVQGVDAINTQHLINDKDTIIFTNTVSPRDNSRILINDTTKPWVNLYQK